MGRLIVLEGIDGSGKATQASLLSAHFRALGREPLAVSFPDYESASSTLARMYLSGQICEDPSEVSPYAASCFFAADRYISFRKKWEKEYRAGRIILADRYTTSNMTFQMEKLPKAQWAEFADWLSDLEYGKLGLPRPDLVMYLDMPAEISRSLIDYRSDSTDRVKDIHERDVEFLRHCREAGLFAAARLGWKVIPCSDGVDPLPPEEIAVRVAAEADRLLTDADISGERAGNTNDSNSISGRV